MFQNWSTKDEIEMSIRTFQSVRGEIEDTFSKIEWRDDENGRETYTGWPPKNGTVDFQDFALINSNLFFTLLDRASFPHYNNTKISKFGWELFI